MQSGSRHNGRGSGRVAGEAVDLTLIVPAYNEADRLAEGLDRLAEVLASGSDGGTTEILIIDDGSTDNTAVRAEGLVARFRCARVIRLPANAGKGAAVRRGVAAARGPRLAFMDADMSIDPAQLPALVAALDTGPVAIGSRASASGAVDYDNLLRTRLGRGFNRLVNAATGVGLADTQCGFKAFRTPVARLLFHLGVIDRFAFDVEILFRARQLGLGVVEVPVHWRHVADSRVRPLHDPLTMLSDVLRSRIGLPSPLPVQALRLYPAEPGIDLVARARTVVGPLLPVVEEDESTLVLFALSAPEDVAAAARELGGAPAVQRVERLGVTASELARRAPLHVLDPPSRPLADPGAARGGRRSAEAAARPQQSGDAREIA